MLEAAFVAVPDGACAEVPEADGASDCADIVEVDKVEGVAEDDRDVVTTVGVAVLLEALLAEVSVDASLLAELTVALCEAALVVSGVGVADVAPGECSLA